MAEKYKKVLGGDGGDVTVPVGEKCDFKIWQVDRVKKDDSQELPNDAEYALVVRQIFGEKNSLEKVKLEVNSPFLLEAFRHVVRSHPAVPTDFTEPFEMESPFQMLYHFWDELTKYRETVDDDVARMHLSLLLDFMQVELGKDREQCLGMVRKSQITYARLWTIFQPGIMVYTSVLGEPWLLRVEKTSYEESSRIGPYMDVYCQYTDYDENGRVGRAKEVFRILQKSKFAGDNPAFISDLDVYPANFFPDHESLISRLADRGKRLLELQGVLVKGYDGLAAYLKEPPYSFYDPDMADFPGAWMPFTESGQVVLDRKTFYEDQFNEAVSVVPCTADDEIHSPPIGNPLFCCPYIYGYSMARKDWCKYFVDNIKDVDWDENAFENLVMKEDQRLLLQALVTSHSFPQDARNQQQQKGKGLVVLLHGTPGSGKTLSAECSAEATKKALLSTTIGELNKYDSAAYFEYRLKQVLEYATLWKAIILLDEADVFLEARPEDSSSSTERTALVAVFLRHLEYFSGIVFLTTNRIQVFDAAMKSRVHLALAFHPPDLRMRGLIWEQYLQRIPEGDLDVDIDDVILTLGKEKLNGREISNAINTAQTLARFQKKPLGMGHLQTVLKVREEFTKNLREKKAMVEAGTGSSGVGSEIGQMKMPVRTNSILIEESEEAQN